MILDASPGGAPAATGGIGFPSSVEVLLAFSYIPKRNLEESIVTSLMMEPGIDVTVVPHLYDLKADGTGMLALKSISGNMVLLSWLFERAAHWVLDRNGIHGQSSAQ